MFVGTYSSQEQTESTLLDGYDSSVGSFRNDQNDIETNLTHSNKQFLQKYGMHATELIVVKATLITDKAKSILVEVSPKETIWQL